MTMFIVGCGTAGPALKITDTACDWVRPVWLNEADQLTPWTARQILRHNEQWQTHCDDQRAG